MSTLTDTLRSIYHDDVGYTAIIQAADRIDELEVEVESRAWETRRAMDERDAALKGLDEVGRLSHEYRSLVERYESALWEIRMAAERSSRDDPPWALPNDMIVRSLCALGENKRRAQETSARRRQS